MAGDPEGPSASMVPSCGSTSSTRTRTGRTAGSSPPRGARTRSSSTPGSSPHAVHALLEAAGQAPGRGARHPRPPRPHGDGRASSRATSSRCSSMRPTRSRSRISPAWGAGGPNPLAEVKDLRTIADGDVLTFAGFEIEVVAHPGTHPGPLLLPDRRPSVQRRPGLRGLDRAVRLPEQRSRRDAGEPPPLPDPAGRAPGAARARAGHDGRARARDRTRSSWGCG